MADKHTLRRATTRYNRIPIDLEFSEVVRYNLKHEDGSREVAVSGVDLLLDDCDAFILSTGTASHHNYGTNYRSGGLNKNGLWESVLEELENTCISRIERPNQYSEKIETVYTVPVVGHKLFLPPAEDDFELGTYHGLRDPRTEEETGLGLSDRLRKAVMRKIKRNPGQFLYWEGKYYDATKVYVFKKHLSNYLKPIGLNVVPRAPFLSSPSPHRNTTSPHSVVEFTSNVTFHNSLHRRVHQHCRILHEGQGQGNYDHTYGHTRTGNWEQLNPSDYLEIDLGYPRCVTHIGTAGEFPLTSVFPTRKNVGRNRLRRFRAEGEDLETHRLSQNGNGVKVNKFASYIRILTHEEETLSWVTSYEVHYRHPVTHKWALLTATSANSDAFTEHTLDLSPHFNGKHGLLTQYLRIKPLEHHNHPRMRVAVYGVDPVVVDKVGDSGELGQEWGEDAPTSHRNSATAPTTSLSLGRTPQEVPTITYALTHSLPLGARRFVRDGLRAYYWRSDYHYELAYKAKALKRQAFGKLMVQHSKGGEGEV